jgi:hypothetical protein
MKVKDTEIIPIRVSNPFKGMTTIILISKEGRRISYNSLPSDYLPEVEKLIRKLSRKFGKSVVKYLKEHPTKENADEPDSNQ